MYGALVNIIFASGVGRAAPNVTTFLDSNYFVTSF